jgi:hypothetical protein
LKSVTQFEGGSWRDGITPYVLLTTFHEVKLCMEILAEQDPQHRPVFTMVVCNAKEGQYKRATRWADRQSVPIYVCREVTCPQSLVHDMLGPLNCLRMKHTKPTLLPPSLDRTSWPQLACHISDHAVDSVQQREEHGNEDDRVVRLMQECWESCATQLRLHDPSRIYARSEEQCWLHAVGVLPAMPV